MGLDVVVRPGETVDAAPCLAYMDMVPSYAPAAPVSRGLFRCRHRTLNPMGMGPPIFSMAAKETFVEEPSGGIPAHLLS